LIITGGTYAERCHYPDWNRLFGSGLRAAVAVSGFSPGSELHTYSPASYEPDILATLSGFDIKPVLTPSNWEGQFEWLHPLDLIDWAKKPSHKGATIHVSGDVVLRFGMLEGDACVKGGRVVYDPQSEPGGFSENSSEAENLAIIMTPSELVNMVRPGRDYDKQLIQSSIVDLFSAVNSASKLESFVLILKDGLGGLTVYLGDDPIMIPTYAPESYFRIGSGDILAAAFSYAWGEKQQNAADAADFAARCLAYFVDGPRIPLPENINLLPLKRFKRSYPKKVKIIGQSNLETESLILYTGEFIRQLNCEPLIELSEQNIKSDNNIPTLVLVGSSYDRTKLEILAERASGSDHRVVFWPRVSAPFAERYFPGARVTPDYASAVFHILRGGIE
jgi:hypothetical protein